MTHVLENEPKTQAAPAFPPPGPPKRTAVATDDDEKRPCKWCGHTKAQHLGGSCRAAKATTVNSGGVQLVTPQQISSGPVPCGCPRYNPKEDG